MGEEWGRKALTSKHFFGLAVSGRGGRNLVRSRKREAQKKSWLYLGTKKRRVCSDGKQKEKFKDREKKNLKPSWVQERTGPLQWIKKKKGGGKNGGRMKGAKKCQCHAYLINPPPGVNRRGCKRNNAVKDMKKEGGGKKKKKTIKPKKKEICKKQKTT